MRQAASAPYVDQVVRREQYEQDHPEVKITYDRPLWRAVHPLAEITATGLRTLLDQLDRLESIGRHQ
jgi:hypothetical protein